MWDDLIDTYRDGSSPDWQLPVGVFDEPKVNGGILVGIGGTLAPYFSGEVADAHTSNKRFILAGGGYTNFNIHEDAGPVTLTTVTHEIAHALGIGSLWEDNEIYNDNAATVNHNRTLSGGVSGQLVGPSTLAASKAEFDPGATFVPVELDGTAGTKHVHWNEATDFYDNSLENVMGPDSQPGDGRPAPTNNDGHSLDDSLMTGVQSGDNWITQTTIANLHDLGFGLAPTPEPGPTTLLGLGLLLLLSHRRRAFSPSQRDD